MRVVLREAAHAEKSVELSALLVAVNKPHFAHSEREIFIASRRELVDKHTAGAVHGFDRTVLAVDFGSIHVVFVVVPVPRIFPEIAG